jgi:hypothetical protein
LQEPGALELIEDDRDLTREIRLLHTGWSDLSNSSSCDAVLAVYSTRRLVVDWNPAAPMEVSCASAKHL